MQEHRLLAGILLVFVIACIVVAVYVLEPQQCTRLEGPCVQQHYVTGHGASRWHWVCPEACAEDDE